MTTSQFVAMKWIMCVRLLVSFIPCPSHPHYLPMSDILLTFSVKVYGIYTNAVYDHSLLRPDVDTLTLAQSSSPFQSSVPEQEATSS